MALSPAVVMTLLAILVVMLIGGWQIARSRAVAIATASQQTQNLANALAQHAARTMEGVDVVLGGVLERLRNPDTADLPDYLRRRAEALPQMQTLQIIDAAGDPAYDSLEPHQPLPGIRGAYVDWHRTNPDPGLHIDVPMVGRIGEVSVIPVSRRITDAQGGFGGVVVATLPVEYFRRFYVDIDIGSQGSIALWLDDGRLLARDPTPSPTMNRDLSGNRLFTQVLRTSRSGVLETQSSAVDGMPRLVGFQRVERFPLVVTASMSTKDALASWRDDAMAQGLVMAIATLTLGGLAIGLERRLRRIAASDRASKEAETLFRGLFENATDCLYVYRVEADGEIRLEAWNPAAALACGPGETLVRGHSVDGLLPADAADRLKAEIGRAVVGGHPTRTEEARGVGPARRVREVIHVPLRDAESGGVGRIFVGMRDITHLKTAEAEAREANRLLILAEQVAHVGHWHVALPAMTVTWSDEVFRIHGLDPAGFTPTVASAIARYHPDDQAVVAAHVERAVTEGAEFDFELRIVRPDGSIRHILSRGFCDTPADGDGPGQATDLFGVFVDLTDLKRAERALAEKSALFEATLESMDQGLLMIARDGTVPVVNERAIQLLGLPAELMASRPTYRAVREHLRRSGAWGESIEDSRYWYLDHDKRTTDLISERRRADGSVIEIRSLPTLNGDGYVQTLTDITQRRLAEERLRDSEARYRLLADYTSDLIVLGDVEGVPSYVSPAVINVLGYGVEDVMALGLSSLVLTDDLPRLAACLAALDAAEPTRSAIYRMRHKAGHEVWIEGAFRRVEEAGRARIVMALRDVTLRQHQAAHLEQAKIAAEAGARIKGEFLANMSHELRTPLTGMLGVHDLLQTDATLSGAQRRLVGLAQESGRALLTIVNDILDFSKIEAGELIIETVPFGLRPLIESCCDLVAESARHHGLAVIAEVGSDVPDGLVGDPARLRQVLLNLTTNAIKFTPAGTVTLQARWLADSPRPVLRIEIIDTGIGIAADKLPSLFQRFSQADGSISRNYGGTGLGLAISRRLVEMMGGELGVVSQVGVGSTFWFELPLARQPMATVQGARENPSIAPSGPYRILFAEDNPINQEIIASVLRQRGHAVEVVGDGAAAVAAVEAGPPYDVVLMDVQMPGQDGLAATSAIRAGEIAAGLARLPIVALTANALAEEVTRCRLAGMDAHVAKPVDWPELFAVIERLIRQTGRTSSADAPAESAQGAPVLDEEMLAMLAEVIGNHRIPALLKTFASDLQARVARLAGTEASHMVLKAEAHALVSLAGQLGFAELSGLCGELEMAAEMGCGFERIDDLRAAALRAIAAAERTPYAKAA